MKSRHAGFVLLLLIGSESIAKEPSAADLILVQGAPGTAQYGEMFQAWTDRWLAAARQGGIDAVVVGAELSETPTARDRLQSLINSALNETEKPLWLVLIGHGTFDRKAARFNLAGPDVSADDLAEWLAPLKRPVAVIDCSASSAPFLLALSASNRIVITATKSGGEENFTRFGDYLSEAIADPTADLDKDNQTSLWEAYLSASRKTAEFYESDGRLLTEHALLDDNGDRQGTRADLFRGLLLKDGMSIAHPFDGALAHQWHLVPSRNDAGLSPEIRRQRDQLELQIVRLRDQKKTLESDEYYRRLERLLIDLATLNRSQE